MKLHKKKTIIGIGRHRIVYDLGNGTVLKVAKSHTGIKSNKTESLIFRARRTAPVRKHLAEIVKYRRRCLVMKKYTRPFPSSNKYLHKYYRLKRKFRKNGIIPLDMYSMTHKKPSKTNLRLTRSGEIIVIDYGNFKFKRSP